MLGSKRLDNLPIRHKISLAFIGTSFIVLLINAAVYLLLGWHTSQVRVEAELAATSSIFAENLAAALSFDDDRAATSLLFSLKSSSAIRRACVYKWTDATTGASAAPQKFHLFAEYLASEGNGAAKARIAASHCPATPSATATRDGGGISLRHPVRLGEETIGMLQISRDVADLRAGVRFSALTILAALLFSLGVAYLLSGLFRRIIETPIQNLVDVTHQVSRENDFSIRAEKNADDEIGALFDSFNTMLAQIQERDRQLIRAHAEVESRMHDAETANSTLNNTLLELRTTQEQLVQQEKMASLGGLVAGVAHEINTPIGVGVTAASTLNAASEDTARSYDEGTLTASGLKKYLDTANQSAAIILKNLDRAAELIQSFKQVAVDQTSSEIRHFYLREYLNEVLTSLRPQLKKTRITVEVDVEEHLDTCTFPGALSQIITNLVMNSLVHAFPEGSDGRITIAVTESGSNIQLCYRDNGRGMSPETLQHVFDPFFTTRRGDGGSGLGMHIVYNLVTQQMQGKIHIESEPEHGMTAVITFPRAIQKRGTA